MITKLLQKTINLMFWNIDTLASDYANNLERTEEQRLNMLEDEKDLRAYREEHGEEAEDPYL